MGENWIGKAVSIKCIDEFGIFQGTIKDANSSKIVISHAFRNGLPLKTPDAEVTIKATDIVKISLIPSYNAANINGSQSNGPAPPVDEQTFNKINIANKETTNLSRSPPNNQKANLKSKSPVTIKSAFGNFIPPKVEVNMGHTSMTANVAATNHLNNHSHHHSHNHNLTNHNNNINNNSNNNNNNNNNSNSNHHNAITNMLPPNNKSQQTPIILQRNASQPIDIAAQPNNSQPMAKSNDHNHQQASYKIDNKKNKTFRRFDKDITFGTPVDDPQLDEDFDFEKNLALFDKRAIWNKIEANEKPDLVRQTGNASAKKVRNYRHDENILPPKPSGHRQITLKNADDAQQEYVTDDGIIIPTISADLRSRIQLQAEVYGLGWERQCDILSRCTAELCLQMLGGARRLTLKNQHQWPKLAIICDELCNERYSEVGFSTGRQLASQGLQVHILVKPNLNYALKSNREAELFKATGNVLTMSIDELPTCDLIILSLPKTALDKSIVKWINESRSPTMAIDPPVTGLANVAIKCSILPILPLESISPTCGKLYLANLAIPDKFYCDAGVNYKSPFGHKFVIPLHVATESDTAKSDSETLQS